jgi:uncharacterized membrane protein
MKNLLTVCMLLLVLCYPELSCKHLPPENLPPAPGGGVGGGGGTGTTAICFESEVLPIFQSNCAKSNCHDAASAKDGYVFDNYQNIIRKNIIPGNATNSKVYKVLFETGNDKMPPAPNADLTAAQKAVIGAWINDGAKNTVNCSSNCDTTQFKYAADISKIMTGYCVGCHGGTAPSAAINLSAHQGVAAVAASGRLYNSVIHAAGYSAMPQNANKLSDCQITQIRKWIANGAPNN